jgi:hypothetical protein
MMIKTTQPKAGLATLFVVLLGLISNSGLPKSRGQAAQTELSYLLDRASKRVEEYNNLFKDLASEEIKTTEIFNRRGEVTEKKTVLSDFFVYQSRFNHRVMYEYRPARSINGKPVANREENLNKLFNKLGSAETLKKEAEILHEENRKGHLRYWYYNLTLDPAGALRKDTQSHFEFEIAGREEIEGRQAVIIGYRSKEARPLNTRDLIGKNLSSDFKNGLLRSRGRFWLDAGTAQMLRRELEEMLESNDIEAPLVAVRRLYDYTPGSYGIAVPKRIVVDISLDSWREKGGTRRLSRDCRITYEYSPFRRFNVTSKEEDKKPVTGKEKPLQHN